MADNRLAEIRVRYTDSCAGFRYDDFEWLVAEIERLRRKMDACLDGLRLARFETGAVARAAVQVASYQLEAALRGQEGAKADGHH